MELEQLLAYPVTEPEPTLQPQEDGNNGGIKGKRMSKKDKLRAAAQDAGTPAASPGKTTQ